MTWNRGKDTGTVRSWDLMATNPMSFKMVGKKREKDWTIILSKKNPSPHIRLNLFVKARLICFQSTGSFLICFNSSSIRAAANSRSSSLRNDAQSGEYGITKNVRIAEIRRCQGTTRTDEYGEDPLDEEDPSPCMHASGGGNR